VLRLVVPLLLLCLAIAPAVPAQEGQFLSEAEAPGAVFPTADRVVREDVPADPALRARIAAHLAGTQPSLWEASYPVFHAAAAGEPLGEAIVVEEIGKHRPITFVVGVKPDGTVADVAVMAYREAYGGEIRMPRFLKQYRGRTADEPLRTQIDVVNVAGATLSVDAASRAVRKAQAVARALRERPS